MLLKASIGSLLGMIGFGYGAYRLKPDYTHQNIWIACIVLCLLCLMVWMSTFLEWAGNYQDRQRRREQIRKETPQSYPDIFM